MPSTLKNYTARSIGNTPTVVFTAPLNAQIVVIGMTVANRTASQILASVILNDGDETYLVGGPVNSVMGAKINVGSSLIAVGGEQKVVMEPGNELIVVSSLADSADVIVSIMEVF